MKDYNYQGESFLNRLYKDLHMADEVMHTASLSDTKDEKVRKYLERLEKVESLAKNNKYHGIELLKEMYYKKYVIKPENVPESYFETQKRIALERGFGHVDIAEYERKQMIDAIINDQKKSLDIWLDYFLSGDALYPEWFKYYAFQGMLKLGSYDKTKRAFNKRTSSTTNIFVDLNREALALIYDNLCDSLNGKEVNDGALQKLLESGSFSKLYAYVIKKIDNSKKDIVNGTEGIWIKYDKGSKPDELVKSLEGKGTGWCTAGIETARKQLEGGDFYVYYTKDSSGECKQPRIAIRMEGDSIGEIRGISEHQNLESEMEEVLDKKLEEFPDKDKYKKKVNDMEKLTNIYKEYKNSDLTTHELRFLYEIDNKIEGFGYQKDPRIQEILVNRSFKRDLAKAFNCEEEEISNDSRDVLNGKKIVCFYGDFCLRMSTSIENLVLPENIIGNLDLNDLISAKGLKFPKVINGHLYLNSLTSAEGIVLPKNINGTLNLSGLKSAEGLVLPENINGDLYLNSLTNAEGIVLPNNINGYLNLCSLKNAEGLVLPKCINGPLDLESLTSIEGLTLPENINGYLVLRSLTSAKGLKLPKGITDVLDLNSLTSAEGLVLPENINSTLNLSSLKSAEGLVLPESINGNLKLDSLKSIKNVVFPKTINGFLNLSSLISAEDLVLPESVNDVYLSNLKSAKNVVLPKKINGCLNLLMLESIKGLIVPKDFEYRNVLSYFFTKEDLIDKSLECNEFNKQKGFSKIGILIIINILIIIGIIFFGCLFMF